MSRIIESAFLLRPATKDALAVVLKRNAELIFEKDGFIRNIHNIGRQSTGHAYFSGGSPWKEADIHYKHLFQLKAEYIRDKDIMFVSFYDKNLENHDHSQCTLDIEMRPPVYRPEVIEMMEIMKERRKRQSRRGAKMNMNLNFYPFQR